MNLGGTMDGMRWRGRNTAIYRHRDNSSTPTACVTALALLDALPPNWAAFEAGEARIGKRITKLQGEGLIPNPLPPIKHNSCLAVDHALTPAYLANPREHVSGSVWGASCTYSTDVATFDAFFRDKGQLPGLAAALGRWHGRALVMQGTRGCPGPSGLRIL